MMETPTPQSQAREILAVDKQELLERVDEAVRDGRRLVQIGCTQIGDQFQIDYSFDHEGSFLNFRVMIPADHPALPTISKACFNAFPYENEIRELFGIRIDGIAVDYAGKFYRKAKERPFFSEVEVTRARNAKSPPPDLDAPAEPNHAQTAEPTHAAKAAPAPAEPTHAAAATTAEKTAATEKAKPAEPADPTAAAKATPDAAPPGTKPQPNNGDLS